MVAVGSGASANLIVATGGGGDIERWDLSGTLINSVVGFGGLYLQKDSMDRVYVVSKSGANTAVLRWDATLNGQETFNIDDTQNGGNGNRFVLREHSTGIDVIQTSFRAEAPIFDLSTIPN